MEKKKSILIISALALIFLSKPVEAQDGLIFRVSGNTGAFISEPGSGDAVADPLAAISTVEGETADFTSQLKFGIEAEIIKPLGNTFSLGIEIRNSKFAGYNDLPVYYNFFASPYYPEADYNHEPLKYETQVVHFLGNLRIYPLGESGTFSPFLKLSGGLALTGTDLRFKNAEDQVEILDPIYSRGTKLTTSGEGKWASFCGGGAAGFLYSINSNIALSAEAGIMYYDTDIIDGLPNFSYNADKGLSEHSPTSTITSRFSLGLCYIFGEGFSRPAKGGSSKSHGKGGKSSGGKTDRDFPFFRPK